MRRRSVSCFALVFFLNAAVALPQLFAQNVWPESPGKKWKDTDHKHLRVERYVPGLDKPQVYPVVVDCSDEGKLYFKPGELGPPHLDGRCVLWNNPSTGWIGKAICVLRNSEDGPFDWKMVKVGTAWCFEEPPDGIPFEMFFPHLGNQTITDDNAPGVRIEVKRIIKKNETIMEAEIQVPSKPQVLITQVWDNGAPWWRQFTRCVAGRKTLHAELERISSTAGLEEELKMMKNLHLSWDERLQPQLKIVRPSAKASEIIAIIENATGTVLLLDERLAGEDPEMGDLQWRGVPAWAVMAFIAESRYGKTHWEPFPPNGFRLEPDEDWEGPPRRIGSKSTHVFAVTVSLSVGLLAAAVFAWRSYKTARARQIVVTERQGQ